MDAPLSATLQFSSPLANSISSWPEQQADITRKVKKMQKALPPFGWDTEPVMGAEMIMEEAFVDVFCDLVYRGGWVDIGRDEVDRECNWALVSASVERIRDRRSDVFSAGRVQVAPAVKVDRFWRCRPAHFLHRFPFRGICAARIPPATVCGCPEQKNAGIFFLAWQVKAMEASPDAQWTPLCCRACAKGP